MPGTLVTDLSVKISDMPLEESDTARLVSVEVDTSLALPDACVVTFAVTSPEVEAYGGVAVNLGDPISVSAGGGDGDEGPKIFDGEVTAVEIEQEHSGTRYFVIRGLDKSHKLYRGRKTRAFQEMTASDIAEQIAGDGGLTPMSDPTDTVMPVFAQANQTDWEVIQQLATESNRVAYSSLGTLHFVKPPTAETAPEPGTADSTPIGCQLVMFVNLARLRAGLTAGQQVSTVEVRGWDPSQKQAVSGEGSAGASNASNDSSPEEIAGAFGGNTYVAPYIPYADQSSADSLAAALAERIGSYYVEIEGTAVGDPSLLAGSAFSIALAGAPFDGKYVATTATHRYDDTGYWTSFTVGGTRDLSLGGLTAGAGTGTAPRPRYLVSGIVTGTVSSVKDPENHGRVQVTFPWLDDSYVSDWCRVMQPGAGSSWGGIVLPEVNSEVLIGFDHGDVRFPFVIGGLYNGQDEMAPAASPLVDDGTGAVNIRQWQSRTKHLLVFNDSTEENGITLQAGDGKQMLKFASSNPHTITLNSDGSITIKGQNVTIQAEQNINIEATQQLSLKGAQVQMQADSELQVSSNGNGSVQASGPLSIQGATVSVNS